MEIKKRQPAGGRVSEEAEMSGIFIEPGDKDAAWPKPPSAPRLERAARSKSARFYRVAPSCRRKSVTSTRAV